VTPLRAGVLLVLLSGAAAAASACRQEEQSVGADGAAAPAAPTDHPPTWRLREALVIGTAVGDSVEEFGRIAGLTLGSDDQVYVYDGHAKRVSTFSRDGTLLRRVGTKGEGPGEFAGIIVAMSHGPGDTLRIFDAGLWRETVFDSSGRVLGTTNLPPPPGMGQMPELDYDAVGRLYHLNYAGFAESLRSSFGRRLQGTGRGEVTIDVWDREGGSWETLVEVPSIEVYFEGGALQDAPFAAQPLWAAVPSGGVWYGDSRDYLLSRVSLHGAVVNRFRGARGPLVVSARDRDAYRRAVDLEGSSLEWRQRVAGDREELPMPTHRPVLDAIRGATDGGVWIRLAPAAWGARRDTVAWHVLSSDGELVAEARLPGNVDPVEVGDRFVLGIRTTPLGVEHVVLFDVERS